jgi:hypothetical protein
MSNDSENLYERHSDVEQASFNCDEEYEEENQDEDEFDDLEEDLNDEEQEGTYYKCPFCKERIYDPFGCDHSIYIWDAVNFEVSHINDELEKLFINIIKADPKNWIDGNEDYDEENIEYHFYKIANPETIECLIYSSEISKIIPSFRIEEAADTDHRSYYIGKYFGIAKEKEIEALKVYLSKFNLDKI